MKNPFNSYEDYVERVFDENKQSIEYMKGFVDKNDVLVENEFYALFDGNVLCKKGRSGVKTSDYLSEEKIKYKSIKKFYDEKGR